jgi:hypothetical protein
VAVVVNAASPAKKLHLLLLSESNVASVRSLGGMWVRVVGIGPWWRWLELHTPADLPPEEESLSPIQQKRVWTKEMFSVPAEN